LLITSRALLRSDAVRFRLWLSTALALGAIAASLLRAQLSDNEEKQPDESGTRRPGAALSSTPKKSPSPIAKAKSNKPKKKKVASATRETSKPPIRKAKSAMEKSRNGSAAAAKAKESPNPIARAKPVIDSLPDEAGALPSAEESPHPHKSNLEKKTGKEDEATPKPKPSQTPKPSVSSRKSKKSASSTPKPKTAKKKSRKKEVTLERKKTAKTKATAEEREAPKLEKTPTRPSEETSAQPSGPTPPPPHAIPVPAPATSQQSKIPRAVPVEERAQVVIEKSGFEEDQGLEPPPSPPPRRFGFWPWSWSRPTEYRYLTRSVIEAIRRAPVKRRRWQFIVVHNSGTRQGNARVFDYYHRHVRRMPNGLAYHFVIGNGTSTGNGEIEVGDRWRRQINGGHVHSDYLNNISLGICLVGDFNRDQPTRAQLESCEELIRYLRERCGKVDRRDIPVRPHREMNPPRWPTDCPGDVFPYRWFQRFQ
jgi:N-acetylmuramoyl-L-alanine amidase-like protein